MAGHQITFADLQRAVDQRHPQLADQVLPRHRDPAAVHGDPGQMVGGVGAHVDHRADPGRQAFGAVRGDNRAFRAHRHHRRVRLNLPAKLLMYPIIKN